jgi:4-hydroxy-3-methylbut-2-enyl diphosphate reductase
VVEATCPLVHRAHEALARMVQDGFHPVVIGQPGHVEVRGLTEDYPGCDVILQEKDLDPMTLRPRYGVVSQTTQPVARVRHLVGALRARFPTAEVRWIDTVCRPTKERQAAAEDLATQCDVVVVIGGAHSNNTRELAQTCRRFCARVHQVQSATELQAGWFRSTDTVGLTAGTSTPDDAIEAVHLALTKLQPRELVT